MKVFNCPQCKHPIFFENSVCLNCNSSIGFQPVQFMLIDQQVSYCANHNHDVCNWIATQPSEPYCLACSFNRVIPLYEDTINYEKWRQLEQAKHRLIYQLGILKLPLVPKSKDETNGLAFDFLIANNAENKGTGHANGIITILLDEGDSVHREQVRRDFSEPYRTVLGHFRHEIGHYYWMLLADENDKVLFRNLFGDETINYSDALQNYYHNGPPADWNEHFISRYASAHPWEDWAETWAHYLHIMDTLETAHYLGLSLSTPFQVGFMNLDRSENPYLSNDFRAIFEAGISLTCAGNSLNRSMGLPDIYPFIWSETIFHKLEFIHNFGRRHQQSYAS